VGIHRTLYHCYTGELCLWRKECWQIRRIMVAEHAGFCFGVRRAVDLAKAASPAKTLGPIIHNAQVVDELSRENVTVLEDVSQAQAGETVIIRSHGVGRDVIRALEDSGAVIRDATCPFVSRIHDMAAQASREGIPVVVVGEAAHPEVRGILGWADTGYAAGSVEEAQQLPPLEKALVVSQTTLMQEKFEAICSVLKTKIAEPDIRKTICTATAKRQDEAGRIARQADTMLIVGSRHSSNTQKLHTLCQQYCANTHLIESAAELEQGWFTNSKIIGLTAGASTPDCIFKEVITSMNDIEKQVITQVEEDSQEDFASAFEKTLVQIRPGQTITGTVVQITEDEVCVNIGYKADGLVKMADLSSTDVKVGDEIEVEVVKVNDGEGNVILSQRNIVNRKAWEEIVAKSEAGEYIVGTGKEAVKGGLLANVNGVRCFIPASHLSLRYVEKINEFVGQEMTLKIIEVDKTKKRIVASRKEVLKEEEASKKKEIWGKLEIGSVVKGTVRRLADFGAFVDIGGVDGLVHVTDLSWGRVKHPSDVVKPGDVIEVKILNVDPEKERISLSYKQTQPKPWTVAGEKYPVGTVVEGKVVRITTFGAFVELEPGLDGLVHISQCALTRIAKVEDAVNVGDVVRVKVLDVNTEAKRISLSIREVLEDEALENVPAADDLGDDFAIPGEEI